MESELPPDPSKGPSPEVPSNAAGAEALAPSVPSEAFAAAGPKDDVLSSPVPAEALDEANPAEALAAAVSSDLPPGTIVVEPPQPATSEIADADQESGSAEAVAAGRSAAGILVVDDHAGTRRYLERLLGQRWNVKAVPDGLAALEAVHAWRPDLIITDVSMPGLDGFGLLRELRADARTSAIPVLFLSGLTSEEARVQGLRAGATDYLVKPFSSRELLAKVESQIELAMTQRKIAEDMASRDAFYAAASHELRDPINSLQLRLLAVLLRLEQEGRGEQLEWIYTRVSKANEQAARVIRLLDTMLDVSRIANGRLPLMFEDVDLAEVVGEVVDRLEPAERAHITLRLDPTSGRWDRLRLDQIVTNLVTNALKYGDGQPIQIAVTGGDEHARLEVSDHGIGVPTEHQKRIFERFERAVADGRYRGVGLGLWITSRIVDEFGGTLSLESVPGEGSTFIVELPKSPQRPAVAREDVIT